MTNRAQQAGINTIPQATGLPQFSRRGGSGPLSLGVSGTAYLSGSGTYIVPAEVTLLLVHVIAAGGSGGPSVGNGNNASGGGGGGECRVAVVSVSPGQAIPYSIGLGGAVPPNGANPGGDTTFGSITAKGGLAGIQLGAIGLGGTGGTGGIGFPGGNGAPGTSTDGGSGGSSGGPSAAGINGVGRTTPGVNPFGTGGTGCVNNTSQPGLATGIGAGGGGGGAGFNASPGRDGAVIILPIR